MGLYLYFFELLKELWVYNEVGEGVLYCIDFDFVCGGFYECLLKMMFDFVVFLDEGFKVDGVLS